MTPQDREIIMNAISLNSDIPQGDVLFRLKVQDSPDLVFISDLVLGEIYSGILAYCNNQGVAAWVYYVPPHGGLDCLPAPYISILGPLERLALEAD